MEAVLHDTFQEPSERTVKGVCGYRHPGSLLSIVSVMLYPNWTRQQFEREVTSGAAKLDLKAEPVAGYGEEAFFVGTGGKGELGVYARGRGFQLSYEFEPITIAQRDALVKIALSRL